MTRQVYFWPWAHTQSHNIGIIWLFVHATKEIKKKQWAPACARRGRDTLKRRHQLYSIFIDFINLCRIIIFVVRHSAMDTQNNALAFSFCVFDNCIGQNWDQQMISLSFSVFFSCIFSSKMCGFNIVWGEIVSRHSLIVARAVHSSHLMSLSFCQKLFEMNKTKNTASVSFTEKIVDHFILETRAFVFSMCVSAASGQANDDKTRHKQRTTTKTEESKMCV